MNIIVRETVEVPVQEEPEREINLPLEWVRGVWFMEQRRIEMEEAKKERREKIMQAVLLVGIVAFMVGVCWLMGGV